MRVQKILRGFLTTTRLVSLTLTILLITLDTAKLWKPTDPCNFIWTPVLCKKYQNFTMSAKRCCVPNCNKSRGDGNILHLFPNPDKNLDRFLVWAKAVGGDILLLDEQTVFRCRRICHHHFEPQYETRSNRLSPAAVPTLYLQGFQSRQPLEDISNRSNINDSLDQIFVPNTPNSLQPAPSTSTSQTVTTVMETSTVKDNAQRKIVKNFNSHLAALGNKIKKLQNAKDSAMTRLKKALRLSENITLQKALNKFTTTAAVLTMLQFREVGKKNTGRRFKRDEKVIALALYKQGPRAYRWLRKVFILPSPLTLSRMISRASLKPGINKNIFAQLKKKVQKMTKHEKLCVLLFDEVSLKPGFFYNRRKDNITGFVNNGQIVKKQIADHALVFMIRGVFKNYKQPISYTFCAGSTQKIDLAMQIKEIIRNLNAIGFIVIATICDQGATNISAINYLINQNREKYLKENREFKNKVFEVDGHEVIPLFDVPHLIKGIRNNLLTKNLKAFINDHNITAKWDHIIKLYDQNEAYKGLRLIPNLTENHVLPTKIFKMKVKCATQIFSHSVATHMGFLASRGVLPKECEETAEVLLFFDNLFDSLNGSYDNFKKRSGKTLLGAVTPYSSHRMFWKQAKKVLVTMKFVNENHTKSGSVPSLTNWFQTIENTEYIVEILSKNYGLTSLWMRHFNQDPLENFFGCIRSHGCRNVSPTCAGFEAAFASLLINNISSIHSKGSNCEIDTCQNFKSLNKLFFNRPEMSSHTSVIDFDDVNCDHIFVELGQKMGNPKIRAQLEYVTGYVLRKLRIKSCNTCKKCLYNKNDLSTITVREYFKNKRLLTYPSMPLIKCFSQMQDVVISIIRKDCTRQNIRQYIKTIFAVVMDYNFIKCRSHKIDIVEKLENLTINIFIYNWCKDTNKILSGNRSDFEENDGIQKLAYQYCKKRCKKDNK